MQSCDMKQLSCSHSTFYFKSTALPEVSLQKSGTPGSTAASTAPPSADEEASTDFGHLCQSKRAKKTQGGGAVECKGWPQGSQLQATAS